MVACTAGKGKVVSFVALWFNHENHDLLYGIKTYTHVNNNNQDLCSHAYMFLYRIIQVLIISVVHMRTCFYTYVNTNN